MWSVSKALHIPLDPKVKELKSLPFTISYVIRKRQQIDSLSELGKEKMPPFDLLWDGTPEDLDAWIADVLKLDHTAMVTGIDLSQVEE